MIDLSGLAYKKEIKKIRRQSIEARAEDLKTIAALRAENERLKTENERLNNISLFQSQFVPNTEKKGRKQK